MSKNEEPVVGIPYNYNPQPQYQYQHQQHQQQQPEAQYFHVGDNPYQRGAIPPNAFVGNPKGVPIHQTIFRDTPAPFNCASCGNSNLSSIKSKPSLAAVVGCMMPMMLGFCFLCPSMDCLWHKYHYCPSCGEKVGEFEKSDLCAVMDPIQWTQESFALSS